MDDSDSQVCDRKTMKEYLQKVKSIITAPGSFYPTSGPAQLLDYLYIGSRKDATNRVMLRRKNITHVLNCAAKKDYSEPLVDNPYEEDNIAYAEFEALDNESYPILMHLTKARQFINEARRINGRVLVHCEMGVNRSGALCIAYMMLEEGCTLLQALRRVKYERPVILCNEGFQRQLIEFANQKGLLQYQGSAST